MMMSSLTHTHLLTPLLVDLSDTVSAGVCYNSKKSNDVLGSCNFPDNETNNVLVGYLTVSPVSSQLILKDNSKSIHIISPHPLLPHLNKLVKINRHQLIKESLQTQCGAVPTVSYYYIKAVEFEPVSSTGAQDESDMNSQNTYSNYFVVQRKCRILSPRTEVDIIINKDLGSLINQLKDHQLTHTEEYTSIIHWLYQ